MGERGARLRAKGIRASEATGAEGRGEGESLAIPGSGGSGRKYSLRDEPDRLPIGRVRARRSRDRDPHHARHGPDHAGLVGGIVRDLQIKAAPHGRRQRSRAPWPRTSPMADAYIARGPARSRPLGAGDRGPRGPASVRGEDAVTRAHAHHLRSRRPSVGVGASARPASRPDCRRMPPKRAAYPRADSGCPSTRTNISSNALSPNGLSSRGTDRCLLGKKSSA